MKPLRVFPVGTIRQGPEIADGRARFFDGLRVIFERPIVRRHFALFDQIFNEGELPIGRRKARKNGRRRASLADRVAPQVNFASPPLDKAKHNQGSEQNADRRQSPCQFIVKQVLERDR